MNAIIIKRQLTLNEITFLKTLLIEPEQYKIITLIDLPLDFKDYKIEKYEEDLELKKNINYYSLDKMLAFSDKTINGEKISDLLSLNENINVFNYNKFRLYYTFCDILFEANQIKSYCVKFTKVLYFSDNHNLKSYSELPANLDIFYSEKFIKRIFNFISLVNYALYIIIKIIKSIFTNYSFKNKKHIIVDHPNRQIYIDYYTLKERRDSTYFQYLFDKIDSDFIVLREEFFPKFSDVNAFKLNKLLFQKKKYSEYPGEIILLKAFFSYKIFKQFKLISKKLKEIFSLISSGELDAEEKVIISYLKSYYKSSLYFIFRYLAYKRFFAKHSNFKTLTSADENSPIFKSIIDAAKDNKIITIGVQHGNIHDLHPAYIFTQTDKNNKVMSDYTLVWGKYYQDFLNTKGNYPEESLKITGQIRTDIIPVLQKKKEAILFEFVPKNSKIVLFATQLQKDPLLRYKTAYDVFEAAKNIDGLFLIVKVHLAEINDFNYYESIAKEAGCTNYKIIYYYDLYLLLSISDIVITCFSTVGSEAVYFYKPLIIVDHLKQDLMSYHKVGVAFQATNAHELKGFINKILSGELTINDNAYKDFIENYAYKIDGKVSDRCIEFIRSFS